jgi:hypothetical protein
MENPDKLATRRIKTKQEHNTICVGHPYSQTNTNNVIKTWIIIQTTENRLYAEIVKLDIYVFIKLLCH